jgi:hypothetical protein
MPPSWARYLVSFGPPDPPGKVQVLLLLLLIMKKVTSSSDRVPSYQRFIKSLTPLCVGDHLMDVLSVLVLVIIASSSWLPMEDASTLKLGD